jgi:hypothetical protein
MEGLDSEGHHVIEGELDEVFVDFLLQLVDFVNYILVLFLFFLLVFDFLVNLIFYSADITLVISCDSPLIVKDLQQIFTLFT